jgi:hypothetical protein
LVGIWLGLAVGVFDGTDDGVFVVGNCEVGDIVGGGVRGLSLAVGGEEGLIEGSEDGEGVGEEDGVEVIGVRVGEPGITVGIKVGTIEGG